MKTDADIGYEATWGTKVGKDCVSLDSNLCRWLGKRLFFLSLYTSTAPGDLVATLPGDTDEEYFKAISDANLKWRSDLRYFGEALTKYGNRHKVGNVSTIEEDEMREKAQAALRWVAKNLGSLWD